MPTSSRPTAQDQTIDSPLQTEPRLAWGRSHLISFGFTRAFPISRYFAATLTSPTGAGLKTAQEAKFVGNVLMIIKGLFRRYERWNPVHPTSGAFWGMGIGLGCGVGWGPGFGPEVIGYVGAGCGVGFSVGITLVGFGIGLPANFLFQVPYNVCRATGSGALELARSRGLLSTKMDVWSSIGPHLSGLRRQTSGRFSSFKNKDFLDKGIDLSEMKSRISSHTRSVLDHIGKVSGDIFRPQNGLKD